MPWFIAEITKYPWIEPSILCSALSTGWLAPHRPARGGIGPPRAHNPVVLGLVNESIPRGMSHALTGKRISDIGIWKNRAYHPWRLQGTRCRLARVAHAPKPRCSFRHPVPLRHIRREYRTSTRRGALTDRSKLTSPPARSDGLHDVRLARDVGPKPTFCFPPPRAFPDALAPRRSPVSRPAAIRRRSSPSGVPIDERSTYRSLDAAASEPAN